MKKLMTLGLVAMLSVATLAEAKRGGGFKVAKSKPTTSQQRNQQDADFNNTPNNPMPAGAAAQAQQARGNGMSNFVTGAAAGYLLSNVLSPTEAQANQNSATPATQNGTAEQKVENVQTFKQIDPTDPNVIERNANYARYCLGGVQYIVSGSKAIGLMDNQNQPQRCVVTP